MKLGSSLGGGFVVTVANQSGGPSKDHASYFECRRDIGGVGVTFSASTPEQLQAKVDSWLSDRAKQKKGKQVGVAVLADVKPLPSEPVAEPLDDDGLVTL